MGPSGVGPIPHSAIRDAAQRLGMDRDEAEWFGALIAAMDDAYFTHQRECREAEANVDRVNLEDVEGVKRAMGTPG